MLGLEGTELAEPVGLLAAVSLVSESRAPELELSVAALGANLAASLDGRREYRVLGNHVVVQLVLLGRAEGTL